MNSFNSIKFQLGTAYFPAAREKTKRFLVEILDASKKVSTMKNILNINCFKLEELLNNSQDTKRNCSGSPMFSY